MKKYFLLAVIGVIILSIGEIGFSQNIAINATGNPANSSAGLDIDFTNKGFLLPRMTTAQRNAIVSPALGLLIFNTTTNCFEAYSTGTSSWQSVYCMCTTPAAPTANAASGIAQTSFTANWTASAGATAYYLDVATDAVFTVFVLNNVNAGAGTSYSVTGLTCNTTYYYRVRANNSCGTSGNSGTITVLTSSCVCVPGATPVTFSYTGASTTWTVPGGVNCIAVDAKGSQGGSGYYASGSGAVGGKGGRVQSTIAVTPGEILYIYVGGAGSNGISGSGGTGGFNGGEAGNITIGGGGGGGASDVRQGGTALINRVCVGAGGGGGGGAGNSSGVTTSYGGDGGGTTGSTGGTTIWGAGGGGGGTPTSGGAGGVSNTGGGPSGSAGVSGTGGIAGGGANYGGGGGGGGYYGGGGGSGNNNDGAGGGGGGSSYSSGSSTTHTSGFQSGNGQVIITY